MFETIIGLIEQGGYLGVLTLMFLENLFPPIPSEVIMPLAGFLAARGDLNIVGVILAGTMGSFLGALPWYYAGASLGEERMKRLAKRYGRWLTVSPKDVGEASLWFQAHGNKAVFFGRLVPAIRTLISVPAGIARLPLPSFLFYTLAGSLIWTTVLTVAGYVLHTEYDRVAQFMDPGSKVVLLTIVGVYVYRLLKISAQREYQ
ncbi:membrane protein DedA with SNARE-associated domain [Pseudomonas duriflava]|uniref:Membrane protein DedA with SNARE-associated domain n=1 Tax=Pseudomonas duriflava TaxID=459528 RepID=A0A562QDP5_9PSED|nr:DedA family protein [Pseudomonas duriflava]TWI54868.1 membrane protein DedA with SNARE-associated domain [Pseudomonas duriflava]